MPRGAAARRYAKALFQLACEQDRASDVEKELDALASAIEENRSLADVLLRPLHSAQQRRAVLRALAERMQLSPVVRSFASYLIDQRRLVDFETIREAYRQMAAEASGRIEARVRSATPLSGAQQERVRAALARSVGHDVELAVEVDGSLIGGLVAQVGDRVFDGSLRTQLRQLRARLD